jgi:CubicO group peptidase (beta-lactamase class C family)
MNDTGFSLSPDQKTRLMQGHDFDGKPLPDVPTGPIIVGSGGLYSSVSDMLTWLQWHVDRFSREGAEVRLIEHATWLVRDGLIPVYGFDESGDGRSCPGVDRDDASRQSSSHTSESRGASGHFLLRRIRPDPWRRSIHRHQPIQFRGGHGYGHSGE